MTSIANKNLPEEFNRIMDSDEEILWRSRPKFIPYFIAALSLGIGLAIFGVIYFFILKDNKNENKFFGNFFLLSIGFPITIYLLTLLKKVFSYSNTSYAFTNKRVMIRSGFIGTDFKIIDYDKISDIQVTVSFIERAFNVGTIRFYSGRTETTDGITSQAYDRWEAIPNPYEIFKQLKKISVDIKTDFNYPNALRPETNPGYNTKYFPKKG